MSLHRSSRTLFHLLALACLLVAAGWYQIAAAQTPGSEVLALSDTAINVLYLAFFVLAGLAALDPQPRARLLRSGWRGSGHTPPPASLAGRPRPVAANRLP